MPASGRAAEATTDEDGESVLAEYYGWVSFAPGEDGDEPADLRSQVDFTDVTAEDNPDWRIDLNDDVIGGWRTDGGRGGDVTLVWGLPLVRGAVAVTAELDGEPLDQAPVSDGRFTLIAVDAVHGFGDDLYLEVKLWDRSVRQLASESLYAEAESDDEEPAADQRNEPPAGGGVRGRCVVGSAVAVWLVVVDGGEGKTTPPQPSGRAPAAPGRAGADEAAKPRAIHFTVSASGDLLMHQPLLDRARANGGGREYDFAPFFDKIKPYVAEGRPRPLPRGDADGPGPAVDLSDLQHADRARGLDPPQRLGRLRHGLQPLARPGARRGSTAR